MLLVFAFHIQHNSTTGCTHIYASVVGLYATALCIGGFYVKPTKTKKDPQKILIILCKIEIQTSYKTLCELCSLNVELLAFHIGAGIMILWLQGICRCLF